MIYVHGILKKKYNKGVRISHKGSFEVGAKAYCLKSNKRIVL